MKEMGKMTWDAKPYATWDAKRDAAQAATWAATCGAAWDAAWDAARPMFDDMCQKELEKMDHQTQNSGGLNEA